MKLHTKDGDKRWWNSVEGSDVWINKWKPATSRVDVDDANGRFLLYFPNRDRRSVSWTARGMKEASLVALQILWGFAWKDLGHKCPTPLHSVDTVDWSV